MESARVATVARGYYYRELLATSDLQCLYSAIGTYRAQVFGSLLCSPFGPSDAGESKSKILSGLASKQNLSVAKPE